MAKNWWFKFDFKQWRTDSDLRRCSFETRAFWLEVLCVMHEADDWKLEGSYEELGWLIGCGTEVVARCCVELHRTKTADVTLGNGSVTLVSRRLKREANDREQTRLRVRRLRCNADVTDAKQAPLNKKEVISKEIRKEAAATAAPENDPVERRIWRDGIDLLAKSALTEKQARPLLGRLAKDFGNEKLAEAIAVTQAKNPADPKPFLIGVLQTGKKDWAKSHVGAPELVEQTWTCGTCFDTGDVSHPDPSSLNKLIWEPCPECRMEKAA